MYLSRAENLFTENKGHQGSPEKKASEAGRPWKHVCRDTLKSALGSSIRVQD